MAIDLEVPLSCDTMETLSMPIKGEINLPP